MKTTRYYREQVQRKRPYLVDEWILQVISKPIKKEIQEDDRIRYWGYIEALGKHLRVITLGDGETVHNAFPDRDFTEEAQ